MNAVAETRSSSREISGEGSDDNDVDIAPTPCTMLQQKGRQGADLVKDMYKMFDGSALVALGKLLLKYSSCS